MNTDIPEENSRPAEISTGEWVRYTLGIAGAICISALVVAIDQHILTYANLGKGLLVILAGIALTVVTGLGIISFLLWREMVTGEDEEPARKAWTFGEVISYVLLVLVSVFTPDRD